MIPTRRHGRAFGAGKDAPAESTGTAGGYQAPPAEPNCNGTLRDTSTGSNLSRDPAGTAAGVAPCAATDVVAGAPSGACTELDTVLTGPTCTARCGAAAPAPDSTCTVCFGAAVPAAEPDPAPDPR